MLFQQIMIPPTYVRGFSFAFFGPPFLHGLKPYCYMGTGGGFPLPPSLGTPHKWQWVFQPIWALVGRL